MMARALESIFATEAVAISKGLTNSEAVKIEYSNQVAEDEKAGT